MITKTYVKSRKVTKITFAHPADVDADAIELVADAHAWRPVPFRRLRDGRWKLVHELRPGTSMQFRYRVSRGDAVDWWNDADADAQVPNDHGGENALIAG